MKKVNSKGFTMAELLIVVAIIAIMVAIAIPVFTSAVEKAKVGTGLANARAAYAEAVTQEIAAGKTSDITVYINPEMPAETSMTASGQTVTVSCGSVSDSFTVDDQVTVVKGTPKKASTAKIDGTVTTTPLAKSKINSEGKFTASWSDLDLTITGGNTYSATDKKKGGTEVDTISVSATGVEITSATAGDSYSFTLEVYASGEDSTTHNPATKVVSFSIES